MHCAAPGAWVAGECPATVFTVGRCPCSIPQTAGAGCLDLLLDAGVPATGSWDGAFFCGDAGWPTTGLGTVPHFPPAFLHTSIVGLLRRLAALCCGARGRLWLDRHWGLGVPIASFAGHAWPGTLVHDDGLCLLRWMGQLLLSTAHGGWGWCWELVPSPPLWGSGLHGDVGFWPRHFHLGCRVEDAPPLWVSEGITLCSLTVSTRLVPHTIISP